MIKGRMKIALAVGAVLAVSQAALAQYQSITSIDSSYTSGSAIFGRNTLVTTGGYQVGAYYDTTGHVKIARRKQLTGGTWSSWTFRSTQFSSWDLADGHNDISIGVDGSGYLHVAWGVHNQVLQYTQSNASILNDNPITLYNDTVGNDAGTGVLGNQITNYATATYPEFFSVPGSGDLMYTMRANGGSGAGDYELSRFSNTTRAWSSVHNSISQPWIAKDYAGDSLPNVSAYLHGLTWDSTGRLHTSWVWRTNSDTTTGQVGYQTNHNIMYAYSDDQGVTWKLTNGTVLQRNGQHAIDESNATPVKVIPEGSSLINQGDMCVDKSNRPVIASWWAPNTPSGDYTRQYMIEWWDGAQWRTNQVSNRHVENNGVRVEEVGLGAALSMQRPSVVCDNSGRIIVLYRDAQRGNVWTAAYTEAANRDVWTTMDLFDDASGGEPTYDKNRWANEQILNFQAKSSTTSQLSIWEFNWGAYFAPQTGSFWNIPTGGDWGTTGVWTTSQPNSASSVANFGGGGTALAANATVTVTGTKTIGKLVLNSQKYAFNLTPGVGGAIALNNGTSQAQVRNIAGAHTIAVPLTMNSAGADFQNYTSDPLLITGGISGSGKLYKSGTGYVTLTGASLWTGGTEVNGGVLQFGNGGTTGLPPTSGTILINAGGIAYNHSDNLTISNVFTGTKGKVIQNGTGTLTFTGVNTFGTANPGGLVVNSGTVVRGNSSTFSSGIILYVNRGLFDMNGNMTMVKLATSSGLDTVGTITDRSAGTGTSMLTLNSTTSSDFYGTITDGPSKTLTFLKTGTSGITLRSPSTFTGGTSLQNGAISVADDLALGTGSITMTGGSGATELRLTEVNLANHVILNSANVVSTVGAIRGDVGAVAGSTLSGQVDINCDISNTGGHFAGPINTNSSITLTLDGPVIQGAGCSGVIVRSGNVKFSGGGDIRALRLDSGLYSIGAANGIPTNAIVTLATNGDSSLDLKGFNQTLAGVAQAAGTNVAAVTNSSTALSTLTLSNTIDNTFDGLLAGNLNLTKSGAATLTLTNANTFTGKINVTGGALRISSDSNLGAVPTSATAGKITIDGGTLQATASFALDAKRGLAIGPATGTGPGTIDVTTGNNVTYSGIIANNASGKGDLIKTGDGTLTLSGANSYSGNTKVLGGSLTISTELQLGPAPSTSTPAKLTLDGGTLAVTAGFTMNANRGLRLGPDSGTGNGTIDVPTGQTHTVSGIIDDGPAGTGGLTKTGAGTLKLSAANNTYAGNVIISPSGTGGTLSVTTLADVGQPSSLGVGNTNADSITISNFGALSYVGTTVASSNRNIRLAGSGYLFNSGSASMTWSGNIDLSTSLVKFQLRPSASNSPLHASGVISGPGAVWKNNAGTAYLENPANSFAGSIQLYGGTLDVKSVSNTGVNSSIGTGSSISFDGAGSTLRYSGTVAGSTNRAIAFNTAGTLGTVVGAGALTLSGGVTLPAGATFDLAAGTMVIASNGLSGPASLTKISAGTLETKSFHVGSVSVTGGKLKLTPGALPIGTPSSITAGTISISGAGSQFDITNNALVIGSADTTSATRNAIWTLIANGRGGSDASGPLWNGAGIVSSTARINNISASINLYAVGVISNHDLDAGYQYNGGITGPWLGTINDISANDILLRYTYNGDTNLDGVIGIQDYVAIDSTYGGTAVNRGWASGDFNYDGSIGIEDYVAIDIAYAFQNGALSQSLFAQHSAMFGAAYANAIQAVAVDLVSVPEPTIAAVATACMPLLSRRRRLRMEMNSR